MIPEFLTGKSTANRNVADSQPATSSNPPGTALNQGAFQQALQKQSGGRPAQNQNPPPADSAESTRKATTPASGTASGDSASQKPASGSEQPRQIRRIDQGEPAGPARSLQQSSNKSPNAVPETNLSPKNVLNSDAAISDAASISEPGPLPSLIRRRPGQPPVIRVSSDVLNTPGNEPTGRFVADGNTNSGLAVAFGDPALPTEVAVQPFLNDALFPVDEHSIVPASQITSTDPALTGNFLDEAGTLPVNVQFADYDVLSFPTLPSLRPDVTLTSQVAPPVTTDADAVLSETSGDVSVETVPEVILPKANAGPVETAESVEIQRSPASTSDTALTLPSNVSSPTPTESKLIAETAAPEVVPLILPSLADVSKSVVPKGIENSVSQPPIGNDTVSIPQARDAVQESPPEVAKRVIDPEIQPVQEPAAIDPSVAPSQGIDSQRSNSETPDIDESADTEQLAKRPSNVIVGIPNNVPVTTAQQQESQLSARSEGDSEAAVTSSVVVETVTSPLSDAASDRVNSSPTQAVEPAITEARLPSDVAQNSDDQTVATPGIEKAVDTSAAADPATVPATENPARQPADSVASPVSQSKTAEKADVRSSEQLSSDRKGLTRPTGISASDAAEPAQEIQAEESSLRTGDVLSAVKAREVDDEPRTESNDGETSATAERSATTVSDTVERQRRVSTQSDQASSVATQSADTAAEPQEQAQTRVDDRLAPPVSVEAIQPVPRTEDTAEPAANENRPGPVTPQSPQTPVTATAPVPALDVSADNGSPASMAASTDSSVPVPSAAPVESQSTTISSAAVAQSPATAAPAASSSHAAGAAPVREPAVPLEIQEAVSAIQEAASSDSHIRVRLNPRELGTMLVDVSRTDGRIVARLEVESAAARIAILETLPELQQSLSRSGTAVDRVEVVLNEPRAESGRQESDQSQQRDQQQSRQERQSSGQRQARDEQNQRREQNQQRRQNDPSETPSEESADNQRVDELDIKL